MSSLSAIALRRQREKDSALLQAQQAVQTEHDTAARLSTEIISIERARKDLCSATVVEEHLHSIANTAIESVGESEEDTQGSQEGILDSLGEDLGSDYADEDLNLSSRPLDLSKEELNSSQKKRKYSHQSPTASSSDIALRVWVQTKLNCIVQPADGVAQAVIGLLEHETLILEGQAGLRCLRGAILVNGSHIAAPYLKSITLVSPRSSPLITIKAASADRIESSDLDLPEHWNEYPTIISLQALQTVGNKDWPDYEAMHSFSALGLKGLHIPAQLPPGCEMYRDPHSWANLPRDLLSAPGSILVKGPKSAGKSTFVRSLCNRLHLSSRQARILYLDLDPGQSEFLPQGFVTLVEILGPLFTPPGAHDPSSFRIIRSHFLGSVTPAADVSTYLSYLTDLLSVIKNTQGLSSLPLLVNTCGWIRGLGFDILHQLESAIRPNYVCCLAPADVNEEPSSFSSISIESFENSILQLRYSAAYYRHISLSHYFHNADYATPLPFQRPFQISLKTHIKKIIMIGSQACMPTSQLFQNLNCALVALVEYSGPITTDAIYDPSERSPDPATSQALGLGFIRAVDEQSQQLQILTPLRAGLLHRVNCLVLGDVEVTLDFMTDYEWSQWTQQPFLTDVAFELPGSKPRHIRRNLMRRSQT